MKNRHIFLGKLFCCLILAHIGHTLFPITVPPPDGNPVSPIYLQQLAKFEQDLHHELTAISFVANYLWDYEDSTLEFQKLLNVNNKDLPELVSKNPILAIRMLYRLKKFYPEVKEFLTSEFSKDKVEGILNYVLKPDILEQAIKNFLVMNMVYDLDVIEVASGIIKTNNTGVGFPSSICYELGLVADKNDMYYMAIEWLELAWSKAQKDYAIDPTDTRQNITKSVKDKLYEVAFKHDNAVDKEENYFWLFDFYDSKILDQNFKLLPRSQRVSRRHLDYHHLRRSTNYLDSTVNFWDLCAGGNHQTNAEKANLHCWYDRKSHPVLYIMPLKKEILSNNPMVVQIYELVDSKAIENMKMTASTSEYFHASYVLDTVNPTGGILSNARVSVQMFLPAYGNPPLLAKNIEAATRLVNEEGSAEYFQIAAYAFGGRFLCHLDAFETDNLERLSLSERSSGNRIATVMLYLDDTEMGGHTAFLQAGISVKPVKGSAILWLNLHRNGELDRDTYHCACPVILGHKWIATRWIRHHDQFKTYKCGLNEHEKFNLSFFNRL